MDVKQARCSIACSNCTNDWDLYEITAAVCMVSSNRYYVVGFRRVQKELSAVFDYLSVTDRIYRLCL
jgi:hypothetical protein